MPKFVFMPPQDDLSRKFAARLADTLPEYDVAAPETDEEAAEEIKDADAAMGWIPPDALKGASKVRWLHNPNVGPFVGYYYRELIEHSADYNEPPGHLLRPPFTLDTDLHARPGPGPAVVPGRSEKEGLGP